MTQEPRSNGPVPAQQTNQPTPAVIQTTVTDTVRNAPRASSGPSALKASPVLVALAIWVIGGLITANLAAAWGWTQDTERPLRAGTMQVTECHADPGHLFLVQRCSGSATFTPEAQWRADARAQLQQRRNILLFTRSDVAKKTVEFTCYDAGKRADGGKIERYRVKESCYPNGQITGPLTGAKLWTPLLAGIATALLGILAFTVLAWYFFSPSSPRGRRETATV